LELFVSIGQVLPDVDVGYLRRVLLDLCRIPSPTGMTDQAIDYVESALRDMGVPAERTKKGALLARIEGESSSAPRALAAHVDTLGAMVARIKSDGRLQLTQLGSYSWNTVEGEYCTIHAFDGRMYSGTIMIAASSVHVHGDGTSKMERNAENMEVRVDARTTSANETRALGIAVGDFVTLDARAQYIQPGFIKSRHLDDKAGVACMLGAVGSLAHVRPAQTTYLFVSNYEEVGHGAAGVVPSEVGELVAVDMAAVGDGFQTSDEYHVTICVKDASGPYDPLVSGRLRRLAADFRIPFIVDTYRRYSSDASAALRAGGQFRTALIGPGVDASHSFERTHEDGLRATTALCLAYLLSPPE
jgi:putative aminopeptidase FrvX